MRQTAAWMWAVVAIIAGATCASAQQAMPKPPAPKPPVPSRPAAPVRPFSVNPRLPKSTQASLWALQAEELQGRNDFPGAAKAMQTAAELTPEDYLLWDRAGWAHLDNTDPKGALAAFQQGRKAAPAGAALSGGMLITHFALKDKAGVEAELKRKLSTDAVPLARAVVEKGLAGADRTPDWNYALGYLYARVLSNSPRGIGPLEDVVEKDPKRADAWLLLVSLHRGMGNGPQEDAAAIKYLDLQPETADAFRLKAQRYVDLQQFQNAVAEYQDALKKYPAQLEFHFALARVQERSDDAKSAEATLQKAIAQAGTSDAAAQEARAQLAQFHSRQGRYADAARYYSEASSRADATAGTWSTWAALLALSARWEDAAKAMEQGVKRDEAARGTTSPAIREELLLGRYRAAVCRLAAGQKDLARTGLTSALELKGEARTSPEAEIAAFLVWLEGSTGKSERLAYQRSDERWAAFTWRQMPQEGEFEVRGRFSPSALAWRAILRQAQKANPTCWATDYALARQYASGGYSKEALDLLSKVSRTRTDWWAPLFAQGQYYARERNKDAGVPLLRKVLQLAPECRAARVSLSLLSGVKEDEDDL